MNALLARIRAEAAVRLAPVLPLLAACPFCGAQDVEQLGPFLACGNCKQIWNPATGRMIVK